MTTKIGAAWDSGELPPWMQQSPRFDEAYAADRADLAAALRAEQLPADLLAERFGPLVDLTAERDRLPRPLPLVELAELAAARRRTPAVHARRPAALEGALHSTHHPTVGYDRRAA